MTTSVILSILKCVNTVEPYHVSGNKLYTLSRHAMLDNEQHLQAGRVKREERRKRVRAKPITR